MQIPKNNKDIKTNRHQNTRITLAILILICLFFNESIVWLINFWLADSRNLYLVVLLCLSGILFYIDNKNREFNWGNSLNNFILIIPLIFLIEFINLLTLDISLISAILFFLSLISLLLSVIQLRKITIIKLSPVIILFFMSLPIVFYLNSTLGYVTRKIYSALIFGTLRIIEPSTNLVDTTIVNNSLFINIDTGCSGILSMYMISAFVIFLSKIKKLGFWQSIKLLVIANLIYLFINFAHLLALTYAHNVLIITNIRESHEIISTVVTLATLVITYITSSLNMNTNNS